MLKNTRLLNGNWINHALNGTLTIGSGNKSTITHPLINISNKNKEQEGSCYTLISTADQPEGGMNHD